MTSQGIDFLLLVKLFSRFDVKMLLNLISCYNSGSVTPIFGRNELRGWKCPFGGKKSKNLTKIDAQKICVVRFGKFLGETLGDKNGKIEEGSSRI